MFRTPFVMLLAVAVSAQSILAGAQENPNRPGRPGGGGGNTAPAPTPTPAPAPAPVDTSAAKAAGLAEGQTAGAREGQDRGPVEGRAAGLAKGLEEGRDVCEKEERRKAYDEGYHEGFREGERRGAWDGSARGRQDGEQRGRSEGDTDGIRRADSDARTHAYPVGRERGYNEANQSDAPARGNADGIVAGDAQAREAAERTDYPRGRKAYSDERWAEAVAVEESFNQKNPPRVNAMLDLSKFAMLAAAPAPGDRDGRGGRPGDGRGGDGRGGNNGGGNNGNVNVPGVTATPDNRYNAPSRTWPTPEENAAYRTAYNEGYKSGFQGAYAQGYSVAYQAAYRTGQDQGCNEARNRRYPEARRRGEEEGHRAGYDRAYRFTYDRVFREYYDANFREYSDAAYRRSYQGYYDNYFEQARSEAYRARYNELYNASYEPARAAKYAEMYPGYAQAAFNRGRTDEAAEFAARPVRILGAEATETIVNGVFEPGEALRVKVKMRNFGGNISRDKLKLQVQALDASSAVITEAEQVLAQNIKAKSITTVGEALEFRMNENAVNRARTFRVSVVYQGNVISTQDLAVTTKFMIDVNFAESPELKEGLESVLRVKVKNQSRAATDAAFAVKFSSDPKVLEIQNPIVAVGVLNAGEERVIDYKVIARGRGGSSISAPVVFEAALGTGRRVGLMDREERIPLVNDYRIHTNGAASNLRTAGVTRVSYTITNVGSRMVMKGLQLKVSVTGDNSANFAVVGPNPQYLQPLLQGQNLTFVVPVLAKSSGMNGVLELEVQEDGRTVVIHRAEF